MADYTIAAIARERRKGRHKAAVAQGTHTLRDWLFLTDYCGGRCVRCGTRFFLVRESGEYQRPDWSIHPAEWERFTKDHIRPLVAGGSDAIENLQPLCRSCNSTKGTAERDYRPKGWRDALDRARAEGWQRPNQILSCRVPGYRENWR